MAADVSPLPGLAGHTISVDARPLLDTPGNDITLFQHAARGSTWAMGSGHCVAPMWVWCVCGLAPELLRTAPICSTCLRMFAPQVFLDIDIDGELAAFQLGAASRLCVGGRPPALSRSLKKGLSMSQRSFMSAAPRHKPRPQCACQRRKAAGPLGEMDGRLRDDGGMPTRTPGHAAGSVCMC